MMVHPDQQRLPSPLQPMPLLLQRRLNHHHHFDGKGKVCVIYCQSLSAEREQLLTTP